jgi:hypothetical protein
MNWLLSLAFVLSIAVTFAWVWRRDRARQRERDELRKHVDRLF